MRELGLVNKVELRVKEREGDVVGGEAARPVGDLRVSGVPRWSVGERKLILWVEGRRGRIPAVIAIGMAVSRAVRTLRLGLDGLDGIGIGIVGDRVGALIAGQWGGWWW